MAGIGVTGFIGVFLVVVLDEEARRGPVAAAG
jgi:hypothetical protein